MDIRSFIRYINGHAGILSLIILIFLLISIPLTLNAVNNRTIENTQAVSLSCIPYPPCYYATNKCVLPQPSAGAKWCNISPKQSCGTIVLQGNNNSTTVRTQNAESCFWNAYQQCSNTGQNSGKTLTVIQYTNNSTISTTYTTKLTPINGVDICSIAYTNNDTSSCTGVNYTPQVGLQFKSCDNIGDVIIPPTDTTITPSPSTVTPTLTCTPRPACLDTKPQCEIAQPINGWCSSSTNNTCQSSLDCSSNQVCLVAGPIRIDQTTKQPIIIKHCYNKGTIIPN